MHLNRFYPKLILVLLDALTSFFLLSALISLSNSSHLSICSFLSFFPSHTQHRLFISPVILRHLLLFPWVAPGAVVLPNKPWCYRIGLQGEMLCNVSTSMRWAKGSKYWQAILSLSLHPCFFYLASLITVRRGRSVSPGMKMELNEIFSLLSSLPRTLSSLPVVLFTLHSPLDENAAAFPPRQITISAGEGAKEHGPKCNENKRRSFVSFSISLSWFLFFCLPPSFSRTLFIFAEDRGVGKESEGVGELRCS